MEILAVIVAGIVAGNIAALLIGGYSLGAIGNSVAGMTGALFLSKYLGTMFSLSTYPSMLVSGLVGALFILIVFKMAESLRSQKRNRLF